MKAVATILVAAGCLAIAPAPAAAQAVRVGQMRSEAVQVETERGPIAAQAVEAPAELRLPGGRGESGYVVGVYEPSSRLFWWRYERGNRAVTASAIERLKSKVRFYLVDATLVSFVMNGRFLDLRESRDRADSPQAGLDKAVAGLNASLAEIESGTKAWFTRVDLERLGADFFLNSDAAMTADPPRVVRVAFAGGRWDVTLEGPNKDTARVTLDDKYSVVGVARQPAAARD